MSVKTEPSTEHERNQEGIKKVFVNDAYYKQLLVGLEQELERDNICICLGKDEILNIVRILADCIFKNMKETIIVSFEVNNHDEQKVNACKLAYKLTAREKEILEYIVSGLSYKMIAAKLYISYNTVRGHMKNIYTKLQVSSLTEVVAKAIKNQIV